MTEYVSAQPGDCILIKDTEAEHGYLRVPVVAYTFVDGKIAFPITPMATGGLLKASRALLTSGMVIDRGFAIPFDGPAEWLAWAETVEPGEEEPEAEQVAQTAPKVSNSKFSTNRKTFASKSFWSRVTMDGKTEAVTIEPGWGLPLDAEGWEKIKRDDFANLKRDAKNGESVVIRTWSEKDGLVEDEPTAEEMTPALDDDVEDLV